MDELDNSADELDGEVAPAVETSEEGNQETPETSEETQEEVSYVTVEQFEKLQEQLAGRDEEILRRAKQSNADRYKAIQAEVETIKARNKAIGVELSPEQERMMRQKVEADMTASDLAQESPSANGQGASSQDANAGANNPIDMALTHGFSEGGTEVLQSDPEGAMIDKALRDPSMTPFKLADIARKAAAAKAQRLDKAKEQARLRQPTGGGGASANKNMDALVKKLSGLQAKKATPENLKARAKVLADMKNLDKK